MSVDRVAPTSDSVVVGVTEIVGPANGAAGFESTVKDALGCEPAGLEVGEELGVGTETTEGVDELDANPAGLAPELYANTPAVVPTVVVECTLTTSADACTPPKNPSGPIAAAPSMIVDTAMAIHQLLRDSVMGEFR